MPRVGRNAPGGIIYHVINRGNGGQKLFHKPSDYDAFIALLVSVAAVVPVKILAYCLMPNHWHLVLLPRNDGDLGKFMLRLTTAHVRRCFAHTQNQTGGHLYQGRYKSFPVQDDHHLLVLMRYVEANALRGGLVRNARNWKWGSFAARATGAGAALLSDWPIERPRNWADLVADALPQRQLEAIRTSLRRGRPLGSPRWIRQIAAKLGLQFTLRPRGRPRKPKTDKAEK
jgi:putative transposase